VVDLWLLVMDDVGQSFFWLEPAAVDPEIGEILHRSSASLPVVAC
jgi:hypothetical protein